MSFKAMKNSVNIRKNVANNGEEILSQTRNWSERLHAAKLQKPTQALADKRTDWSISALRLIAICCIIACHLCQLYELEAAWWLNSAVQVFLFISGWLFGLRSDFDDVKKWITKRFKRICVPFWITACLIILLDCIFAIEDITLDKIVLAFLCIKSGSIPNGAHLWYVSAMLLCYLITPLLSALWKHWGAFSLVVATVLIGICGGYIVSNGFWCADYVLAFLLARVVRDGASETRLLLKTCIAAGGGAS
jgi:peptidoglycan/LPS O-acetylase OafA/YrhL